MENIIMSSDYEDTREKLLNNTYDLVNDSFAQCKLDDFTIDLTIRSYDN